MIAVYQDSTARTIEYSFRQGHLLSMSTHAACLTRIGWIDFDKRSASFFRFARELTKEGRPRGIGNTFGETVVMHHAVHAQILDRYHAKSLDDGTRLLMGEVLSSEGDTLMNTCHDLAMLPPFSCPFGKLRMLALHPSQSLFLLAEKARVGYLFPGRERSKSFESDVNAHLGKHFGQAFGVTFTREGHIPFPSRGTMDGTGFDCASHRSVRDHLDRANLGEAHPIIMSHAEARLREGEGVVSILPTEPGKPWLFSVFTQAAEEGFECEVNAHCHVLKDLRVNSFERSAFGFQYPKGFLLLVEREALSFLFIGGFTVFKQVVIEPTALVKRFVELVDLLLIGIQTVLKGFLHACSIAHMRTDVKRQVGTQPHCPKQGTPLSSPWINRRGFQRRRLVKTRHLSIFVL